MQKPVLVDIDIDLQDLIPQFLMNRKNDVAQLVQLSEQNDLPAIAQLAHKIKGTAAGYGFADLSDYASQLELISKGKIEGDINDIKRITTAMKDHFDRIEVRYISMS
jgi:HPt (histidine-containing phosphotransfer) domain-containing protein